jgi:hypothetical protein
MNSGSCGVSRRSKNSGTSERSALQNPENTISRRKSSVNNGSAIMSANIGVHQRL